MDRTVYQHHKGGVYVIVKRTVAAENLREHESALVVLPTEGDFPRFVQATATDEIAKGQAIVVYRDVHDLTYWTRPATLFFDGRFTPVTLPFPVKP